MNLVIKFSTHEDGRSIIIPQQSVSHEWVSATSRQLPCSHKGNSARVTDSERVKPWSRLSQTGSPVWLHLLTQNPTRCFKFLYVSSLLCEGWLITASFPVRWRVNAFKSLGMTLIIRSVNSCYLNISELQGLTLSNQIACLFFSFFRDMKNAPSFVSLYCLL